MTMLDDDSPSLPQSERSAARREPSRPAQPITVSQPPCGLSSLPGKQQPTFSKELEHLGCSLLRRKVGRVQHVIV